MIVKASSTAIQCTHCGLPVPAGRVEAESTEQFCCSGCDAAYQLICSSGLDAYYKLATEEPREAIGSQSSRRSFAEFDEPVFQEKFVKQIAANEKSIQLAIEGLHCAACIWLIEKLPTILDGVRRAKVNWARATVVVHWDEGHVTLSEIATTLNRLGYRPHPVHTSDREQRFRLENRRHLTRLGIAAAIAGNNMLISAAMYLGMFSHMTASMTQLLRVASCIVGLAALLIPGRVFLKSAFHSLRTRTPHMDLPIALALTVGTIAGTVNVIRGVGDVYFDSLAVLIFLLLVGRWILFRQQSRAADAVEMLYRLTPRTTRKLVDGEPVEILVDLVKPGDVLQIRAGDQFPVDATIMKGSTRVDESILSGESRSVSKHENDSVLAGTLNVESLVLVSATATGDQTRLAKIVDLVEQASLERPAIVQWANRIGGYFVVVVIFLAALTFGWWCFANAATAIDRTVALLIVACPCALALATPLTVGVALGQSARKRIMIKSGDVLQSLQKPGTIWLDKTGTLTDNELSVERWYGDERWLAVAAELERYSTHPVARAIVRKANENGCERAVEVEHDSVMKKWSRAVALTASEVVEHPGLGVQGKVGSYDVLIGNTKLLNQENISIAPRHRRIEGQIVAGGKSPCWIVTNHAIVAVAVIGDSIRIDAKESIEALKRLGWECGILSGDHPEVVARVANRLGIPNQYGGVSPERKLEIIQQSSKDNTVVMVGDGVNDCAALAAATVGIAVQNSAEASLAAAPVYLAESGLKSILKLMQISKSTVRTQRLNLGISIGYNFLFAMLAFLGWINPLVAAIVMPISSLTVVSLSLTAGRTSKSECLS